MNRSKFEILGLNQEKVFNLLSKEVKVYKIKRIEHNKATFEVDSKNEDKVYSILKDYNLSITLLGRAGFKKRVKKLFSSVGLIVGCVICFLIYLIQYNFILKIEVWGNEEVSSSEIKSYADEILTSRFKKDINTKQVEEKIKKKFEEVSSVSVAIVGQTLVINLNEADIPPEMGEFEPIISQEEGLITKISLIQGTLNVKVGDIVKKGDILVYPYIVDTDGEERKVQPKAEIEAEVWLRAEYCHKDYVVNTQRTGRTSQVATVLLFGKEIYRYEKDEKFEFFEEERCVQDLITNNILPLKLEKKICYELENIEIIKPFEENKSEILDLARQNVLIFLKKNEIIKDEKYFVRNGGGCHFVDYIITVSRNIGG